MVNDMLTRLSGDSKAAMKSGGKEGEILTEGRDVQAALRRLWR